MAQAIATLIAEAKAQGLVRTNRYGVSAFEVAAALLPEGVTYDRYGVYDVELSADASAQIRRRKGGYATVTFCGE